MLTQSRDAVSVVLQRVRSENIRYALHASKHSIVLVIAKSTTGRRIIRSNAKKIRPKLQLKVRSDCLYFELSSLLMMLFIIIYPIFST